MNGYLVVLRCHYDDLPVFFTADEEEAIRVAKEATEDSCRGAEDVLSIDHSEASNISIWDFVDGRLARARVIQEF